MKSQFLYWESSRKKKELFMQAIILDQKLKSLIASERKITHEILLLIQTLDITKSFRELGYSSLFEYLTKEIGYSEGSAQRRISSARLMKQVPEIANDLKSGNLNLTQVALVQAAIRQEEKAQSQKISFEQKTDILEKLKSKTTFETQKILKDNLPAFEIPKPKVLPADQHQVHVTLQFSERDWEKVQSLMAHFSHTIPDQKIESLLLYWQAQVEKKKQKQLEKIQNEKSVDSDPQSITLAQKKISMNQNELRPKSADQLELKMKSSDILPPLRQWKETATNSTSHRQFWIGNPKNQSLNGNLKDQPLAENFKTRRSYIPTAIKVQVRRQAEERCEYISQATGRRCESRHFLETEHRVPLAQGGTNAIGNLRLYCRSHNALVAKAWGILK